MLKSQLPLRSFFLNDHKKYKFIEWINFKYRNFDFEIQECL